MNKSIIELKSILVKNFQDENFSELRKNLIFLKTKTSVKEFYSFIKIFSM